jgi:multisubunit Na+/H+ antiporter MnhC subunit
MTWLYLLALSLFALGLWISIHQNRDSLRDAVAFGLVCAGVVLALVLIFVDLWGMK